MVNMFCRVVTVIVLILLLFAVLIWVRTSIQRYKRDRRNKELTKQFIWQFLVFRDGEYGTTRHMIERALCVGDSTIFGCLAFCPEVLRKLAVADLITIRPASVDEVVQLEELEKIYGPHARWMVEGSQVIGKLFGAPPDCLIRLTQHGRSLIK